MGGGERAARGARDGALVGLERVRERSARFTRGTAFRCGTSSARGGARPGRSGARTPTTTTTTTCASTARDSFREIRGSEPRGAARRGRRGRRGGVGREGEAQSRRRGRASVRSVGATRPRVWDARARRGVFPSARASSNGRLTNEMRRLLDRRRVSRRGGSVHVSFSSVRILPRTKFCRSRRAPSAPQRRTRTALRTAVRARGAHDTRGGSSRPRARCSRGVSVGRPSDSSAGPRTFRFPGSALGSPDASFSGR